MSAVVGIIAGSGALPSHIARVLTGQGRDVVLAEMQGFEVDNPQGLPVIPFQVEKLGALFKALRKAGARDVVFAGAVRRPKLDPKKFDLKTMTLAPRVIGALKKGDDGLLRVILEVFEAEGFAVRAAHELAPDLLPEAGVLTSAQPSERDRKDAARAEKIVTALAAADVGQGAVVAQGVALAVEAAPGTDQMLAYVVQVAGKWRPDPDGGRGVLFKAPKPGQDRRVDLPAIGPGTITAAAEAGLAGVVIEAGGVMILERTAALARAEALGLFIWARPAGGS